MYINFNPRPSYEERHVLKAIEKELADYFNPRPSYEERHGSLGIRCDNPEDFNPRPSYEERLRRHLPRGLHHISIHAPHTRSDLDSSEGVVASLQDFNPRPSYEERRC